MTRPTAARDARAAVRRSARRVSGVAADRYRAAVLEQSRWLPVYLAAVDAADLARRAARGVRRRPAGPAALRWDEPDAAVPAIRGAGLSAAGELSLVLTGPESWLRSVDGLSLVAKDQRVELEGGLHDRVAGSVRVCVPLPLDSLPHGRWQVELRAGEWCRVAASGWSNGSRDTHRGAGLDVVDGQLVLVRESSGPVTVEHRVSTGVARLAVEWAPPPGGRSELLLLRPDGTPAAQVTGTPVGDHLLGVSIEARTLDTADLASDERVLTVAVAGPDGPVPLTLGPGGYPALSGAPTHGTARLGHRRVRAGYDGANRLQLQLRA